MKMEAFVLALLSCLSRVALAQDSVSVSDFRYPETRAIDWKGGVSGSMNSGNYNDDYVSGSLLPGKNSGSSSYAQINLSSSLLFFHTKDDHDQNVQLTAEGYYSGFGSDRTQIDTGTARVSSSSSKNWSGSLSLNWTYLHYLTGDGVHLLSSISTYLSGSRSSSSQYSNDYYGEVSEDAGSRSYFIRFRGTLGIGYGRIRDGTVVFQSLRIVERLKEDGLIIRSLSKSEMETLIDLVSHKREYTVNFERYEKYLVQDIIAELARLGVIDAARLGAFSALRVSEAFRENIYSRFFGWRVYYTFHDVHDQSRSGGQTSRGPVVRTARDNYVNDWAYVHEAGAEFGRPLSLWTHVYSNFAVYLPNHNFEMRFLMQFNMMISHEVGERIKLLGTYKFSNGNDTPYSYDFGDDSRSRSHTFQGIFVYFLEDQISFNTSVGYGYRSYDYGENRQSYPSRSHTSSGISFSFGLVYNII